MSGLSDIAILILDGRGHVGAIQVTILRALGVGSLRVVSDAGQAIPVLREMKPDACLINGLTDTAFWVDAVTRIRDPEKSPDPFIPMILMAPDLSPRRVRRAIALGLDSVLAMPVKPIDVFRHLTRVALQERLFVRRADYFGPCRRRMPEPLLDGPDRRRGYTNDTDLLIDPEIEEARRALRAKPTQELVAFMAEGKAA